MHVTDIGTSNGPTAERKFVLLSYVLITKDYSRVVFVGNILDKYVNESAGSTLINLVDQSFDVL